LPAFILRKATRYGMPILVNKTFCSTFDIVAVRSLMPWLSAEGQSAEWKVTIYFTLLLSKLTNCSAAWHSTKRHSFEFHYAKCHSVECHRTDCISIKCCANHLNGLALLESSTQTICQWFFCEWSRFSLTGRGV
jgi:hypothetical protein